MLFTGLPEAGGINVREDARGGLEVRLSGEFDRGSLPELRDLFEAVAALGAPTVVDLSRVSFLDLGSAREIAVCSQLHADRVSMRHPSPQVLSSFDAFGLQDWVRFAG